MKLQVFQKFESGTMYLIGMIMLTTVTALVLPILKFGLYMFARACLLGILNQSNIRAYFRSFFLEELAAV